VDEMTPIISVQDLPSQYEQLRHTFKLITFRN